MNTNALNRTIMTSAENLAKALGGRKAGAGWMARCPAHDDKTPSLSISESTGRLLVHCHAGCDQEQVIDALRARGLWGQNDQTVTRQQARKPYQPKEAPSEKDESKRTKAALCLWRASVPATGTLVETYLRTRGLQLPPPQTLRFHKSLKHPTGGIWPAMISLVTHGKDDHRIAIHRTFLARDGSGKVPVSPQKMMLGPCRGGAVRLGEAGEALMVGEGIETCLAASLATGRPAWAALSTSGLRALDLPHTVHDVIVLADGDDPGEAAACACALQWKREGRHVRIARPPRGCDFNDMLMEHMPDFEENAA